MDVNLSRNEPDVHFEHEIKNQALVRLYVVAFMGSYFLFTGHWAHPLYVGFIIYAVSVYTLASAKRTSSWRTLVITTTLLCDNGFSLLGLHVTADAGYFLFVLLAQIACGFGTRFGRGYLWLSATVSALGIVALWMLDSYWSSYTHACIAFAIGVPFLGAYFSYLRRRVERNAFSNMFHARECSDLLSAFAHDVRAQLQALHLIVESLEGNEKDLKAAQAIDGILRITKSIARITTFEIRQEDHSHDGQAPQRRGEDASAVSIGNWLGDIVQRFRASLDRADATLYVWFEAPMPRECLLPAISVERALINVLSNACRHVERGELIVSVAWEEGNDNEEYFRISVENTTLEPTRGRPWRQAIEGFGDYSGAGMGQAITAHLVRSVGGYSEMGVSGPGRYSVSMWIPAKVVSDSPREASRPDVIVFSNRGGAGFAEIRESIGAERVVHAQTLAEWPELERAIGQAEEASVVIDLTSPVGFGEEFDSSGPMPSHCIVHVLKSRSCWEERLGGPVIGVLENGVIAGTLEAGLSFAETLNSFLGNVNHRAVADKRLDGARVLLVDDSASYCERLTGILKGVGARVDTAQTTESAFQLLRENHYDVLVSDWFISDRTARDLLDKTQGIHFDRKCPQVYILTGADSREVVNNLGSHSVRAVVTKPVSARYLLDILSKYKRPTSDDIELASSEKNGDSSGGSDAESEALDMYAEDPHLRDSLAGRAQKELETVCSRLRNVRYQERDDRWRREIHSLIGIADAIGAYRLGSLAKRMLRNNESLDAEGAVKELENLAATVQDTIDQLKVYRSRG